MARRGTAIVETTKGILLVKEATDGRYALPGGQAKQGESRLNAAIRELYEETGLQAIIAKELFPFTTNSVSGRQTDHKAILIKAKGDLSMTGSFTAKGTSYEVLGVGFFNLKYLNQPDLSRYQGHVYACLNQYINGYQDTNYFSDGIKFR